MAKPNIIFIMLDDFGWKDSACYGSDFYETPNLDRLAAGGMKFSDAYAACPVCSPTRASIMSGKVPARVGVTDFIGGSTRGRLLPAPYTHHLPLTETSIAAALKAGGYTTWHLGKWHLGEEPYWPEHHGFDVNVGGCHMGHPWKGYFSPWGIPTLEDGPAGEYLTDRITDEAINLVKRHKGGPFFMNLWTYTVHTPIQAKPEYVRKYEAKIKAMGLDKVKTFEEGEPFPTQDKRDKRVLRRLVQSDADYAAMIEIMDENVGRLVKALEETGQRDNTVIIFTSDNGGLATAAGSPTCNAPLAEGKGWMYEGGTREPLIVNWPGVVEGGSTCDVPVTSPDFYPTLLEIAGLDPIPEQHVDGVSLMPLITQRGGIAERAIYWHYPHYGNQGGTPGCSMRMGDYKLIEFFEDGRLELYNLREDISEEHNLAARESGRAAEMHRMLVAWRESVAAKLPVPNPGW